MDVNQVYFCNTGKIDDMFTLIDYNKSVKDWGGVCVFGYIIASAENLPKERQERFRAMYCGLCRTLRSRYGLTGGLTLSYDMTFLAVLLNALYEPDEHEGRARCPVHPAKRHAFIDTPVLDYCAGMNVALAYHKCLDNWRDDKNPFAMAEAKLFKRAYGSVCAQWPEQCQAIEAWLDEIHRIEADDIQAIDPPVNSTGQMLARLFQYRRNDVWAESLGIIGDGLGRFIYLMDAWDDLPRDIRRGSYNPLKAYRDRADYEDFVRDALLLAIADATREFELLPIDRDADILRNILYSGIWSKYALIRKKRDPNKEERDHAGSL